MTNCYSKSSTSTRPSPAPVVATLPGEQQTAALCGAIAAKSAPRWISQPERVWVGGRELTLALSYVGTAGLAGSHHRAAEWTIDPSRPVRWEASPHLNTYAFRHAYDGLSPPARGAFLRWHDGGRVDALIPVNYVELFLMGVSAHVGHVDGALPHGDASYLVQELSRLKQLYGHRSHQVFTRCTELTNLLSAVNDNLAEPTAPEPFVPNHPYWVVPDGFPIRLGRVLKSGEPISPTLALEWLMVARTRFRTPVLRATDAFQTLFAERLKLDYPHGFVVPVPNRQLAFRVWCPSDGSDWHRVTTQLPNYSRLRFALEKLRTVALACSENLEPYSRYVGRVGTSSADSTAARLLLPESAWPGAFFDAIDALAARVGKGMQVINSNELLAALGTTLREPAPTEAGWERLFAGLSKRGLALEWVFKETSGTRFAASAADSSIAVLYFDAVSATTLTHQSNQVARSSRRRSVCGSRSRWRKTTRPQTVEATRSLADETWNDRNVR